MRYKRAIKEKVCTLAAHFPAVVLTGARQTGKTTLLRHLFPHYRYVSLDLPADAWQAENDPETFLRRFPPPLVVDEVQYAPQLFRHLKTRIDVDRKSYGRFILTGSQKFSLMKEVTESLAGRVGLAELETLSASELGDDLTDAVARHGPAYVLNRGLFPQLWDESGFPREEFYRSYLATYIERDVRQILNITSLRDFDRFMRVCAVRTGQLVNKTQIAKNVGVSPKTINEWLSILHASNQIILLEPFFENVGKRVVKSPKLYFNDCGLAAFLLGLNQETILESAHLGHLWETFVFAELRKSLFIARPEASIWFYRDQQREADFVISAGPKITVCDAKWGTHPSTRDFKALEQIAPVFGSRAMGVHVITTTQTSYPRSAGRSVLSGFGLQELIDRV